MAAGNRIPILTSAPKDTSAYVHKDGQWEKAVDAKLVQLDATNKIAKTQLPEIALRSYINNWELTKAYTKDDVVIHDAKIFRANDNITANAGFVIGASGTTWSSLSSSGGGIKVWAPTDNYIAGDFVLYNLKLWYTLVGSSASLVFDEAIWKHVYSDRTIVRTYMVGGIYEAYEMIAYNDNIYYTATRLNGTTDPAPNPLYWIPLTQSQTKITTWNATSAYPKGSVVLYDDYLFYTNTNLDASPLFVLAAVGGVGWKSIRSLGPNPSITAHSPFIQYAKGTLVSTLDKIYYSNSDIPAMTVFAEGTTGATWTELKTGSGEAAGKIPAGTEIKLNSIVFTSNSITVPDADLTAEDVGTWIQVVDYSGTGTVKVYLPRGVNSAESVEYQINTNYGAAKFVWAGLYWVVVSGAY